MMEAKPLKQEEAMITVRDIMTPNLITVTQDMDIAGAAKILLDNRINGVPNPAKKAADPHSFYFPRRAHPIDVYETA